MRKKLLVVVAAFALVLCMPAVAFAANSAFDKGTAESTSYVDTYTGNAFLMERDALNLTVERDLYWAGDTLNARGLEVGGGTGGSALLAGSYAGDVNVSASTINVSRGTTVGGTLRVPNNAQVAIEEGANVPNVSYVDDALVSAVSEGSEQRSFSVIGPLLFSCVAHALLVLLFFFLIKDAMESAVKLAETKLSRMFMLGFVAFFVLPLLGFFLLFPLVTAPISALIFIFIAVLWMFSIPFAGYVLGRRLFEGMAPLGAGVIGTLVLTAVCYIPYLFFVVPTVCSIFVAGCLTQSFLDKRVGK